MSGWRDISTARKDGTHILVVLEPELPTYSAAFAGLRFVARHPGMAEDGFDVGWQFAAPVGMGGFPDEWIAGWQPLPPPPTQSGEHGK